MWLRNNQKIESQSKKNSNFGQYLKKIKISSQQLNHEMAIYFCGNVMGIHENTMIKCTTKKFTYHPSRLTLDSTSSISSMPCP
jgi:hypothetical protein